MIDKMQIWPWAKETTVPAGKIFTGYEIGPHHKLTPHYIDRPPMGTIDTVLDQFKANMATAAEKMASAEIAMLAVEGFVTLSANRTRRLARFFGRVA